MQIDQIILRPDASLILLQHTDSAGGTGTVLIDGSSLDEPQTAALTALIDLCQKRLVAFSKSSPSLRLLLAAIEMGALLSLTVEKIGISSSIHSSGERCCRWIVIRPQRFGALPFGRVAEACIGLHPVPVCIKAV